MSRAAVRHGGAIPMGELQQASERPDSLPVLMLALLCFGLLMMSSASVEIASSQYGDPFHFTKRQLLFAFAGIGAALVTLNMPLRFWYETSWMILMLSIVLLALVLVPGVGKVVNGSARWIDLGFFSLQPSEMAKAGLVLYFAAFLQRRQREVHERWSGFIKPMAILAAVVTLLHFEPDHGAMVILVGTAFGMLFLAGARLHRFVILLFLGLGGIAALAVMKPYVVERLTSFLNPWAAEYVYGEGYQLTQALIAFGRGEWFGVGLGNSIQKLYFLPEAHTDFVAAIIAEELGLFGVLFVLALFCALVTRALVIGRRAEQGGQLFGAYVAYGIAMVFACQVFINIGVNTGLLPTKGLTLPFISYGGNSLLVSCFMIGLLLRIQYETALATGRGGGS